MISRTEIPLSVWSAPRTSRYLRMTKRDPCGRDWDMIMYSCLLRQCRKCFTVGKGLVFFSLVPCLGKGSVLTGLHWLPAGQRVDFKMHSADTCKFFIARLPYIYASIREPLSYYRSGKNLLSLQTLIDHIVFLTLKFMDIVPLPLLL